jgi:antitoxin YqcF
MGKDRCGMAGSRMTEENKEIFRSLLNTFGDKNGKRNVQSYWDEAKENWIDIVACPDSPSQYVSSYGTIGLSDFSIHKEIDGIPLGIEIVGMCDTRFERFPNIISTCAFNIILDHATCSPGIIYKDMIEMYMSETSMKHILFVPPFGWNTELRTLHFPTKKVAWLLAVPISEEEFQYAKDKGVDALETLLEEKQIEYYDLDRESTL